MAPVAEAAVRSASSLRPEIATLPPRCTRRAAMARPMPLLPPVTSARTSESCMMIRQEE
jgi:hypothetical protein